MANLSKLRVYKPPDIEDHAIVTASGTVYNVAMDEPEYTVGSLETAMIGFGPGTWLPASSLSDPEPASKDFNLVVDDRVGRNVKRRVEGIEDALLYAAEVWRPDGLMLPVTRGAVRSATRNTLEATVYPTGPHWQHPLLDRVTGKVPYALESSAAAPIVNTVDSSALHAFLTPARMPEGSLCVGVFCNEPALYSVASVGATISAQGQANAASAGIFYSLGTFYAHAFGQQTSLLGTTQVLRLFALTWQEERQARFYSYTADGLIEHGSFPVGSVPAFSERELSLGYISGVGGIEGAFMPGAPRLGKTGVPFLTQRVLTWPELNDGLGAWYRHLTGFSQFTPTPVAAGLELLKPAAAQIVIGVPKEILVTVLRTGGLTEAIKLTATPDNISLRAASLVEVVDSDFTTDIFKLTLLAEEGLTLGDHSVSLTATTVSGLRSTAVLDLRTFNELPALPPNTTHEWRLYDPVNKSLATMRQNTGTAGAAGDLVLNGLARFSNGWDAVVGDGSDIAPYGPAIVTVDNAFDMATDYTVSWAFWDVDKLPLLSILFSGSSMTNKWDFWQIYIASTGLRLRVSKGTTSQTVNATDAALSIQAGVMHLSVKCDADGNFTLENPTLDQTAVFRNPGLSGSGRLTLFGTKLSDGTVQGLSAGTALVGSIQTGIVT